MAMMLGVLLGIVFGSAVTFVGMVRHFTRGYICLGCMRTRPPKPPTLPFGGCM